MSQEVQDMFGRIAGRYDRANAVLSLGTHRGWRRKAVKMASIKANDKVLDVACGTGDLSFALAKKVGDGNVVGVDFTKQMLEVARIKATRREQGVDFQWGDAQALPFPDNTFDAATIAFGIRNVDDPSAGLAEMHRVVKPGGRVVVLEFGQPTGPIGLGYRFYSRRIMPTLGGWMTGDKAAYEYLPRTAAAFPAGDAFVELMHGAADFTQIKTKKMTGGITWCYAGQVG